MRGINRAFVFGHLGRDPEQRTTPAGRAVVTFTVATNRSFKRGDEWVEATDWHFVEVWERQAEVAMRHLSKGSVVGIEGRIQTDSWVDKDTGRTLHKTKVVCENLHLVERSRLAQASRTSISEQDEAPAARLSPPPPAEENEVPF